MMVILGTVWHASAQTLYTGYLGHKTIIGYHFITGINFDQITSGNTKGPAFLARHEFIMDFVLDRDLTFGFESSLSNLNFSQVVPTYIPETNNNLSVHMIMYGVNYKYFITGTPAPVGSYFKIKGGLLNYYYTCLKDNIYENKKSQLTYLGLGYGKKRVFYDKIILDLGVECNFIFGYGGPMFPIFDGQKNIAINTLTESAHRISQDCFINYSVGIEGLFWK